MEAPLHRRDDNLDLLRAGAIVGVVLMHLVWTSPVDRPTLKSFAALGGFGVDLFFVLSGWLTGGQFWRQQQRGGPVLGPFLRRRLLRTVPPYFAAMSVNYLFVLLLGADSGGLNWRYFVFLQNYGSNIHFFNVSWSLCVEEHYYLIFPLAMILIQLWRPVPGWIFPVALAMPVALRTLESGGSLERFDYSYYASHLHCDSLIAGIWASWIYAHRPQYVKHLVLWARRLRWALPVAFGCLYIMPERVRYIAGFTILGGAFVCWLIALVGAETRLHKVARLYRRIALTAFSCYLTHMFAIHGARMIAQRWLAHAAARETLYYTASVALCVLLAAAFYSVVEKTTLELRRRYTPRF